MDEIFNKDEVNIDLLTLRTVVPKNQEIQAYKRRWIILTIFICYAVICACQWAEYSIINNIIVKYYNVSPVAVNWTSLILMTLYPIVAIPASFILDKMGLRVAALIGSVGTAIGTTIKVFSLKSDRFWVVLLGQAVVGASQNFIFILPPKLAAVWFKSTEVSTACALGVFGNQIGTAIGFVLSPIIVQNSDELSIIENGLRLLCYGLASAAILAALAVIIYFPKQPPKPPSITQIGDKNEFFSAKIFFKSLLNFVKNKPFLVHVLAYGIHIGVFSAVSILLNQLILHYFTHLPDAEMFAGRTGLCLVLIGTGGCIVFGFFLDRTHKYKETTVFIYFMAAASVVGLMFALELRSTLLVYFAISIFGIFTNAYMAAGYEFGIELTYPSSESTTTNILLAPSQVIGMIFTLFVGQLNDKIGPFWSLGSQVILLSIGTVLTYFVPNVLRRQEVFAKHSKNFANNVKK